jgi:hypothetical protein
MRKTIILLALLAAGAAIAQPVVVAAPTDAATTVAIPVAAWAEAAREIVLSVVLLLATFALRFLPGHAAILFKIFQVEQLLRRAVDYGMNSVVRAGGSDGALTVDVGNAVAAKAVQYAIDNGPAWLVTWMGGAEGVRQKIFARLPIAPDAPLR